MHPPITSPVRSLKVRPSLMALRHILFFAFAFVGVCPDGLAAAARSLGERLESEE